MKTIALIEPSSSGLELLKSVKDIGLTTLVFSSNTDERIIPQKYQTFIDELIIVDTYDINELYKEISLNKKNLRAIIPGSEYHVPIAAQVAARCNLPGVDPNFVQNLRNKYKMREALAKTQIRIPRYIVISTKEEITSAIEKIAFPCVLKPVASAGSIHVTRLNSAEELIKAYEVLSNDPWSELSILIGKIALIEEYINGEEFSVEGFIQGNTIEIISITKKFLSKEPYFIEMGHIVPADISAKKEQIIKQYIIDVINGLNINLGIFHAEIRYDEKGPVLMEIAGRLPGCRIPDLIKLATEINFYQVMIDVHSGDRIAKNTKEIKQYAGMCYFDLAGKETFTSIVGLDELQKQPGFYEFKLLKDPGEYVPPLTSFLGRVAYCIFTAGTYKELEAKLDYAKKIISFE